MIITTLTIQMTVAGLVVMVGSEVVSIRQTMGDLCGDIPSALAQHDHSPTLISSIFYPSTYRGL